MTENREPRDVEARLRASLNAYADVVGEEPARRPPAPAHVRDRPSRIRRWRAPVLVAAAVLAVTGGVLFVPRPAEGPGQVAAEGSASSERGARATSGGQESAEENSAAAAAGAAEVPVPAGQVPAVPTPAEVGVSYAFDLFTHCGIFGSDVGGVWFAAVPPLVEAAGSPPAGWDDPYQRGSLVLESPDEAVFRDDRGHELTLRAAPDSERPPPCD